MQRLTDLAAANAANQERGRNLPPPEEDLQRKIECFIRLKAPTFSFSADPIDADD